MKKRKKKNAITLLALVITIVIMLLLAGVAIQMTMGENGLIAKSVQAQKEQAKAELYDTAKLSYMSLNAKALENGQPSPQAELALSTTEFTNKYNVVGDDITDKKGTVIDTKVNVLNIIQGTVAGGFTPGTTTPAESWPKIVAGVTIPEEEKNDMIWKLKVKNNTSIKFGKGYPSLMNMDPPMEVDYGNGQKEQITNFYDYYSKEYNTGEYVLKFKNVTYFGMGNTISDDFEIEILQWGKIEEYSEVTINNVIKIHEQEPDKVVVSYVDGKFTEIPEWLFKKKVTSEKMSKFIRCNGLTSIPESLFNNNVNITVFNGTFEGCTVLTNIPEGLFNNNVNVTDFNGTFAECTGLTSIPENLFKYNIKAVNFGNVFYNCTGLTSIPESLFNNNVNVTSFHDIFAECTGLTSIPENLFKYNIKAVDFWMSFYNCTGLTSIPENLFKHNMEINRFNKTFEGCTGIIYIPDKIIEAVKRTHENGGNAYEVFKDCTSASNYNSIPSYMKEY